MLFRVTFRDGRELDIEGDEAGVEPTGAVLIWRDVHVMNKPRRIVARRFLPSDGIARVEPVTPP